jgi:hypothetical protein
MATGRPHTPLCSRTPISAALTGVSAAGYEGARVKLRGAYTPAPSASAVCTPSLSRGEPGGAPYRPGAFLCAPTVEQTTYTFAAAKPGPSTEGGGGVGVSLAGQLIPRQTTPRPDESPFRWLRMKSVQLRWQVGEASWTNRHPYGYKPAPRTGRGGVKPWGP